MADAMIWRNCLLFVTWVSWGLSKLVRFNDIPYPISKENEPSTQLFIASEIVVLNLSKAFSTWSFIKPLNNYHQINYIISLFYSQYIKIMRIY